MKIKAHITDIEDEGSELRIKCQGVAVGDADWRSMRVITFSVPHLPRTARTFYMGRELAITIEPIRP